MSVANAETYVPSTWTCGCVTGRRLCPHAVDLWRQTNEAMRLGAAVGDFARYREACRAFDAHYAAQECGCEACDR